jgi:hypothetical protein
VSSDQALTFLASVVGSSAIAGLLVAGYTRTTERKRQLREEMLETAGNFAGDAMEALARIRDYKPTTADQDGAVHRNAALLSDGRLRDDRRIAAEKAVDRLRPLRGRVKLLFATAGSNEADEAAGEIIIQLRAMLKTSAAFWAKCEADPANRAKHELEVEPAYDHARDTTRAEIEKFCSAAAERMRSP